MPRKYPPLTPDEVKAILKAWRFTHIRTESSHESWEGTVNRLTRNVQVDTKYPQFSIERIKVMISQSGLTRDQFYRATKTTAKKINKPFSKPKV